MNHFPNRLFSILSGSVAIAALLLVTGMRLDAAPPNRTQVIECRPGWNLISIQIGDAPIPFDTFRSYFDSSDKLIEIWGYEPTGDPSAPGGWDTRQPNVPGFPLSDFSAVEQGRAYWVNVTSLATITLTGPAWDGDLQFLPGWNLVGFPGVPEDDDEGAQSLSAVFGPSFDRVSQVWTFDASAQRFLGHDLTSVPTVKELTSVSPGAGYWVYALEEIDLAAIPYLALIQDVDASPLQTEEPFQAADFPGIPNPGDYLGMMIRKPGPEDAELDLNGNGILDSPFTQGVLRFDEGVDRKVISIGNTGSSIVNWSLDNSIPWLFLEPFDPSDEDNSERVKSTSGVVTTERDTVVFFVDRRGLAPGRYEGQSFDVTFGDQQRTVKVVLDVSTAAGDWKGFASAKRIDGKDIPLGKIDLGLNLFMNSESITETSFRAVLNRDESLLFPRDVFMNGIFFQGTDFSLTTNFVMSPGDRNAPPYDTFSHSVDLDPKANAQGDKDYDGDGQLDVMNPFPFAIQREVTLIGTRVAPDRFEGAYVEAVGGMLPNGQKVFIDGTFELDRKTLEPTRRSIFNEYRQTNLPIGGSSGDGFRESVITVTEPVNIQNVQFNLGIDYNQPGDLIITLTGPDGTVVTIHRNGDTLASNLQIDLDQFNGKLGSGDWTLRIEWDPSSGERGTLTDWGIDLQGLATYEVSGRIVGDTGTGVAPLEGAQLVLSGSNVIEQGTTESDGAFTFSGLSENGYTLSIAPVSYTHLTLPTKRIV